MQAYCWTGKKINMTAALFEGAGPSSLLHELPSSKLALPKNRVGRMDQRICAVFFLWGGFPQPNKEKKVPSQSLT